MTRQVSIADLAALSRVSEEQIRWGLQQVAEAVRQVSAQFAELRVAWRRLRQVLAGPAHGPRNHDPLDSTWQSDLCAAWLHDSCGEPGLCDCTCHGGTVR